MVDESRYNVIDSKISDGHNKFKNVFTAASITCIRIIQYLNIPHVSIN